ncbi:MAG: class I SAM-dependent methyltransferase [bacterium]|nr:class I SAM-dependent methyltransferase [bacterium]
MHDPLQEWWRRVFVEYADEYLALHRKRLDALAEKQAFYLHGLLKYMERRRNDRYIRLLDVPCGYGRLSKHLLSLGYDVTGVDISEKFIDIARTECRDGKFVLADMRKLPFQDESFDAVLNIFASFGYFSDQENEQVLREFARVLRVGGLLIMDLVNGEWLRRHFEERSLAEDENYFIVYQRRLEWPRMYEKVVAYRKKGREAEEGLEPYVIFSHYVRLYTPDELAALAERHNLVLLEALESWTIKRLDRQRSPQMLLVFMKV